MSRISRNNFKKLYGKDARNEFATDDNVLTDRGDIATVAPSGGGAAPAWMLVASGLIPNGQASTTVYTAKSGRQYACLAAVASSGTPFVLADLPDFFLASLIATTPNFEISPKTNSNAGGLGQYIVDGSTPWMSAAAFASPGSAFVENTGDSALKTRHTSGGGGTNGAYLIYEAS